MALVPFFLVRLGGKMLFEGTFCWLRYAFGLMPSSAYSGVGIAVQDLLTSFCDGTTLRALQKDTELAQALVGLLTYGAGMLVGNYVAGWWETKS